MIFVKFSIVEWDDFHIFDDGLGASKVQSISKSSQVSKVDEQMGKRKKYKFDNPPPLTHFLVCFIHRLNPYLVSVIKHVVISPIS